MSKNIVVITSMYPQGQQAPGQEYCINTWKWWCNKNNVELFIFDEPIADIEFMNPIWQKWWVSEILENSNIEYDKIATVDIDTMIRWDTPNFFDIVGDKFGCVFDESNVGWVHESIKIYQKFFPNVKFDWTTYFNSGYLIYNKSHKHLVEAIKNFWLNNDQELYNIQKTYKKGNDQTPVNYITRDLNVDIKFLDKTFNMTHLQRKEVLKDLMFTECGYIWHFNGFDKQWREPLMKDTWNKIKDNYEN